MRKVFKHYKHGIKRGGQHYIVGRKRKVKKGVFRFINGRRRFRIHEGVYTRADWNKN
jgi:hypothetical protein